MDFDWLRLLGVGAIIVLVVLFTWQIRKQTRLAAANDAFLAMQREAALAKAHEIVDDVETFLNRRMGEIMLSAPERMRPSFLTILNEELDDNGRYSKADFILAADAIFRTIALDWAADYAERLPPDPTTSVSVTE